MAHEEQDLFDDFNDQPTGVDLFGDVGELEEQQPALQDEEEELLPPEEPAPARADPAEERRIRQERLMALVKSKRGADDGGEGGGKKKRHKKDKERGRERGGGGSGGGDRERPKRLRRQPGSGGGEAAAAAAAELGEVPEQEELEETDADKAFIDDEDVPEDERYEGDDEAVLAAAEEAEEVAPGEEEEEGGEPRNILEEVLARRKRKRRDTEGDIDNEVMALVSMMVACADQDAAAIESRPPQPAVEKLKALGEVGATLRQRKYHEAFLGAKGLNALAAWLRPYSNGVLPNAKVRGELVSLLGLLQLDASSDYVRERLEEAELGKIVMFYFKNPNESMALRSACRDLIQAWSAPIFADNDEELRKRRQRERAHRQRQAAERADRERQERQEVDEAERRRKLGPADVGFRARAAVPQPSRMDFVINPGSRLDTLDAPAARASGGGGGGGGGPNKPKQSPIGGRLGKVLQQRKRGARDRMGGVSVEGRGIQL